MICLLPHPIPPLTSASCLSFLVFLCVAAVELTVGSGGAGVGGGAKSHDGEKAWSSTNHSILSERNLCSQSLFDTKRACTVLYHLFSVDFTKKCDSTKIVMQHKKQRNYCLENTFRVCQQYSGVYSVRTYIYLSNKNLWT
jgi:hypothetical protein